MQASRRLFLASAMAMACSQALASRSTKPINIVVGYQAGGGTDAFARIVAEKLGSKMGQPAMVVNKPGATGAIGAAYVSSAPADGNTLLFTPGSFSHAQFILPKNGNRLAYDPVNDFVPVAHVANVPIFLVTHKSSGINSLKDVLEMRKSKNLSYATTGTGSVLHIVGERFNQMLPGEKIEHIPYKGVAPAVNDLVAGHIPLAFTSLVGVIPYLKDGTLKLLATTSAERSKFAPDTPTFKELGFDIDMPTWFGMFAPKNTPASVITELNQHLNDILQDPEVVRRAENMLGAEAVVSQPGDMDKLNRGDYVSYEKIISTMKF